MITKIYYSKGSLLHLINFNYNTVIELKRYPHTVTVNIKFKKVKVSIQTTDIQ